ncbi:MAG TPA: hypothetical protein VF510_12470 [Ktedonobacterales bacterium]
MSQRTRARTTGDATSRRNKPASQTEPAQATQALSAEQPDAEAVDSVSGSTASTGDAAPAGEQAAATESAFAPETLARTLRAVAAELERDPDLARRVARAAAEPPYDATAMPPVTHVAEAATDAPEQAVEAQAKGKRAGRTFRPRLVTGLNPDLGQGVVDPFALYASRGEDGLRAALDELRLGSLRAIVREHQIDPSGKLAQQNDAEKLRAAILKAARKRRP